MSASSYFVVDIETCPLRLEGYSVLSDEDKRKLMNPVDSRIVAIGVRNAGSSRIFMEQDEKRMLESFWGEWRSIAKSSPGAYIVGFNISRFDLPFITARSFIHGVVISPFVLKSVVDVREKINAYKYGHYRGRLKEYAAMIGLSFPDMDGSRVADLCINGEWQKLKEYLESDLFITDKLYQRLRETNILYIQKW